MRVSDTGVAMTYKITGETNLVAMEILAWVKKIFQKFYKQYLS
jgi:hypothetical protein